MKKPDPTYDPGDKIGGRFLVHQSLMGSMGEVYLCLDLERNYPLALKTFQRRFLTNRKLREAFYTEVATWVALEKHPNIVRCFYMDTVDDRPFMFLEWIASDENRGTDLRSWLRREPLSLRLSLTYAIDICRGLIHAGDKQPGIVHRDLKPENVLVAQGYVAKITDFGLASIVKDSDLSISEKEGGKQGRQSMVGKGGVVGTPAYMAPEQWRAEEPDVRTDIYALGCILYEMLAGRLPFMAKDLEGFLLQHLNGPIPKLSNGNHLPIEIDEILGRCLAKRREDRFLKVTDFLSALTTLYEMIFKEPPRELQSTGGFTAIDYNYRGVTYDKLDRYDEALADYTRAVRLDPGFVLAFNNRGATYERLRRYAEAISDYTSALKQDPDLAQVYYNRGNVYSKMKQPDEAIEEFTCAIDLEPSLMRAYISRGGEYYTLGRYQEALEDFSAAIELVPTYEKAYINRAIIYDSLEVYDKALADYSKAIDLNSNNAEIYFYRGLTYNLVERYSDALSDFNQVIEMESENHLAYYYRGQCHGRLGNKEDAIADHTKAIQLGGPEALSFLNLGGVFYVRNSLAEALVCFERALELGDSRAEPWIAQIQKELNPGHSDYPGDN